MWVNGGKIALIRLATLAMRLALTVYVTGMLGLAALGQFGIVLGLAAFVPAAVGMGLNFHLCREIVGGDAADRIATIRDRMRWTCTMLAAASAIALPVWWYFAGPPTVMILLAAATLWLEALAMDIYLAMTGLRENVLANIGVALRSAAWVPIAIGVGLLWPELRSLETILACWIVGHLANLSMLAAIMARRGYGRRWRSDAPTGWVRGSLAKGVQVWPSDIALVLITFGDRFILSATVSDDAVGLYVFYWTFANMIQTLAQSAIVTPALPRLVEQYGADRGQWMVSVRRLGIAIPLAGIAMAAGILTVIWLGHRFVPQAGFPWQALIAVLVFAAVIARFAGDFLSTVLNSAGAVRSYTLLNTGFAAALMLAIGAGALGAGIEGAAVASLLTALLFNALKLAAIVRLRS
ncbi:oligosaccharide flippase family protein [Croceicoccus bisphenolivorans]|uniref:oligosaccharide flippase family protein n=1 Tax=Croceicoccus bisphenolivorans TaxID=1783232 RepID=UPI00082D0EA7|nr:oligosaccharide flippase family protein [Croceicoccus bisphenolivorans]